MHRLNHRLFINILLGFSCGLPLALTSSTLQAWYAVSNVDIVTIGFLALVGQPYAYKFLWAPLLDRYVPPLLGRRRGWMLITQALIIITLLLTSLLTPEKHAMLIGLLALAIAVFSASQDTVVDAYRTDLLQPEERGFGVALYVTGYRIAMLVSGGLALVLADHIGFKATFISMAFAMSVGVVASWFGPEPSEAVPAPKKLKDAVVEPFKEFLSRPQALLILLAIVLYKFGDAFAGSLTMTFLLRGIHFSLTDIGSSYKLLGLIATLLGTFWGGWLMTRWGLFRCLLVFGGFQAISNLTLMLLAIVGKHYGLMLGSVFIENLCGGMGSAAFLAWLMSLCDHRYTATQYALFSAIAVFGRVFIGPLAGVIVKQVGWSVFFFWTFTASLPGLLLIWWLREHESLVVARGNQEAV